MESITYCMECEYFQRYYIKGKHGQENIFTGLDYGCCIIPAIRAERKLTDKACEMFEEKK